MLLTRLYKYTFNAIKVLTANKWLILLEVLNTGADNMK